MKILIIGSGKVGSTIAKTLSLEKFEVDLVDRNEKNFEEITNSVNKIRADVLEEDFFINHDLSKYDLPSLSLIATRPT